MQRLSVQTRQSQQFVDITHQIGELVALSGIQRGSCHLFVPHTTAGVTLNENCDPDVEHDMLKVLDRVVPVQGPKGDPYRHAEGNSHAHIKASLMGSHTVVLIEEGRLILGQWQGIFFTEFDGPRNRTVMVRIDAVE